MSVPSNLGYQKDLFILAFDHRGSFMSKLFGIKDREPSAQEAAMVSDYKKVIYEGFQKAVRNGVAKSTAGILVDAQFGSEILADAKAQGFVFASPAEKSGQDEFDFEYGNEYGSAIHRIGPTFVKVLVRYNPEGDKAMNQRQTARLKALSEYCLKSGHKFIFELLVPSTDAQIQSLSGTSVSAKSRFDLELRPQLMVRAMAELQAGGVEPDVWKIEGVETVEDAKKVAAQARVGGRRHVGCVILGRGEDDAKVGHWLSTAAKADGFIGFAVGRTIFWDALEGLRKGTLSREAASDKIAGIYKGFVDLWAKSKG